MSQVDDRMRAFMRSVSKLRLRAQRRGRGRVRPVLLLISLGVLAIVFTSALQALEPNPSGERVRLDQLDALAERRAITEATFRDEDAVITGRYTCPASTPPAPPPTNQPGTQPGANAPTTPGTTTPGSTTPGAAARPPLPLPTRCSGMATGGGSFGFWMPYPKSDLATGALIKTATDSGARVQVDPQTGKAQLRMVTTFVLPLIMLANLFALLFGAGRSGGSGIGDVIVFGSFRKRRVRRGVAARVTFADVAGADHAVAELAEIVDYLRNPERYREIGAEAPKGVLMIGPPGCGKTLLAKACAGEADVPFFSVAGAEFVESLVGVGAARVRDLFRRVRAAAPAIVFIDELDAAGRRRGAGGGSGGSEEREQTLNQLLVEMDGFDPSSGIVVMAATNRPDILDPALQRPGRFDRQVTVDQPSRDGRRAILALHARNRKLGQGVDLDLIAARTSGFSGAELANVLNEAALLAIRANKTEIGMEEMLESVERVVAGPQRRGHLLTAIERRRLAAHEAGHAIAAASLGRLEDVHRVSILRRARSLGLTSADGEAGLLTPVAIRNRLAALLAGLAAEQMMLGEPSTGAESDLEEATTLARDLVGRYGMSDRLGRARLLAPASDAFLDDRVPVGEIATPTHREMDEEVRRILDDAERAATAILEANRKPLDALVRRLEAEEIVEGAPLRDVLIDVVAPRISGAKKERRPSAKN